MKYLSLLVLLISTSSVHLHPLQNDYKVSVSQDTAGNYKIAYLIGDISKLEDRLQDGSLRGTYTYLDTAGKPQTITYIAGRDGFRVVSSTFPQAEAEAKRRHSEEVRRTIDELEGRLSKVRPLVPFTPEAVKATIDHLKAVEIAKIAANSGGFVDCILEEKVTDTPEVKAAKNRELANRYQ